MKTSACKNHYRVVVFVACITCLFGLPSCSDDYASPKNPYVYLGVMNFVSGFPSTGTVPYTISLDNHDRDVPDKAKLSWSGKIFGCNYSHSKMVGGETWITEVSVEGELDKDNNLVYCRGTKILVKENLQGGRSERVESRIHIVDLPLNQDQGSLDIIGTGTAGTKDYIREIYWNESITIGGNTTTSEVRNASLNDPNTMISFSLTYQ